VAAPDLVECPHAEPCPGCPLIALPAAGQLAAKGERVAHALAPYAVLRGLTADPVRGAATRTDYRTRAKLVVGPGPRVGLFARGSHEILDLPGCRVLAPVIATGLVQIRRLLTDPPDDARCVLRPEGEGLGRLRALDLREVRDEAGAGLLVTLVVRVPPAPDLGEAAAAAEHLAAALPFLRGVAVSFHEGSSPQLLGTPPLTILGPRLHRDETRAGAPWSFAAAGGFAQVHRAQAAELQAVAERAIAPNPGRRVLDVYAGSGALGLALAAAGAQVTAIEAFEPAAEASLAAASDQGIEGFTVRPESAEAVLPSLLAAGERFDAVVVNPPRRGLGPRVRDALARLCTERLVYVSCEPETLARDLADLSWRGWRTDRLMPFDLMPLTAEVECIAVLEVAAPAPLTILFEDADWLVVDKPPHLPTVPHPERTGSLLELVRRLPDAEGAVPVHRLDAETSGACLFARSVAVAGAAQRALADPSAAKRYLALVRGIARARGRIARPIVEAGKQRSAATRYRRLAVVSGHALLSIAPETGRTHQIRRHLAGIGQPILGDDRYGHAASNRHLFERAGLDRPFLHCAELELRHPRSGGALRIVAPLAPDLVAAYTRLGGDPGSIGVQAPP
jgi:23S rRNA (uracil1939-C5)-methyltransferase